MKYLDLYLLRHGELINSSKNVYNGQRDIDLTEKGFLETIKWIDFFKDKSISLVLSSDLKRCYRPASVYAKRLSIQHLSFPELREIYAGRWEGLNYLEIMESDKEYLQKRLKDPVNIPFPDGESLKDLKKRSIKLIKKYLRNNENILLVSHAGVIRVLILWLLRLPLNNFFKFQIDFASLTHLRLFEDGNRLLMFHNKT